MRYWSHGCEPCGPTLGATYPPQFEQQLHGAHIGVARAAPVEEPFAAGYILEQVDQTRDDLLVHHLRTLAEQIKQLEDA